MAAAGRKRIVTPAWREALQRAVERNRKSAGFRGPKSQVRAAEHAGCSPAYISQLIAGRHASSTFCEALSDFYDLPLPPYEVARPAEAEIAEVVANLDDEKLAELLRQAKFYESLQKPGRDK